jgi:hypothetical protein
MAIVPQQTAETSMPVVPSFTYLNGRALLLRA